MTEDELKRKVLDFSSSFSANYWREVYSNKKFPQEYWNSLAESNLIGLLVSEKNGGLGLTISDLCVAVETSARWYAGMASYLFLSSCLSAYIFEKLGKDWMKDTILHELISGKKKVCIALTEENSGIDASSIQTVAVKKGEKYVIEGSKIFVSNLDRCDYMILFAVSDEGSTIFLVDTKESKVEKNELDKVGLEFIRLFSVKIDSLELESKYVIGEPGSGFRQMKSIFMMDRLATAASLIGTGWLALDTASEYARRRVVFGKTIGSNQGIQFPLAEAACELVGSESIMRKACNEFSENSELVNIALLSSQKAASLATDNAVQTLGGHGYLTAYNVSRYWKDVRAYRFHPVSEEILLASIALRSLDLPKTY